MSLDPLFLLTLRYFLALLLLSAGLHKSANLGRVREAIGAYCTLLIGFEARVAWLVIGVELIIGGALFVPSAAQLAVLAAAGVFAVYFAVMALSWVRGHREVKCGCSFQHTETSLSGAHLVRNVLLVILAIVGSVAGSRREVSWVDGVQIAAAVACLSLLYLSADALLARPGNVTGREA